MKERTMTTTITLTQKQEAKLASRVAAGDFASIEEAAQQIIDESLFADEMEGEELAWLNPLIAKADASLKSGKGMTLEDYRARKAAHLASLGVPR